MLIKNMKYPEFIKKGDKIGFVAPSFGCTTEPYRTAFEKGLEHIREMGYQTELGPNCYADCGIGISNTPAKCAQELTEYYCREDVKALMSCGGGECMCEVVSFMDFDAMSRAVPKWYMGYSDNTNFTFLANTILDTAAIYGPCANEFGMEPWHPSISDAWGTMTGEMTAVHNYDGWEAIDDEGRTLERPLAPYKITQSYRQRVFSGHREQLSGGELSMEGRLTGGCVDCLVTLLGTRFDHVDDFNRKYGQDGIIWFLECCDLNTMGIRRAMWQMKEAGWFERARGFLIGRSLNGSEMFGTDQYAAVVDLLGDYDVPILMDLDIGHLSPMMPVISGATAVVRAGENSVNIRYTYK